MVPSLDKFNQELSEIHEESYLAIEKFQQEFKEISEEAEQLFREKERLEDAERNDRDTLNK